MNPKINTEVQISEYYNPKLSKQILNDRTKYREELNDILGDISPYWNTNLYYDEDDEEHNDDEYDDEEYDEDDYDDETW